jgi:multiple sugar transport system ATP-binding protein
MVELDDFLHRKPAELSGGQRQRVALARAIVRQPNVFLMDEPLSNLDAKLRVSTRAQIKNLSHELAVTTVYVTHDQIEAMTLADRVVVMKGGVSCSRSAARPTSTTARQHLRGGLHRQPGDEPDRGHDVRRRVHRQAYRDRGPDAPDGPATLGFRAEDASVVPSGGQINAPIYTLELLGDATMVTVRIGQARWSACGPTRISGPRSTTWSRSRARRDLPPLRRKER